MVNNIVYEFADSNLGLEIFLLKREHQNNGSLKLKIEASLYTLYWGFKKIPFTLYTYVLTKILQNMKNLYINWLLVSKIMWVFGQLQTSTRKSKKLKFDGLILSKKYIASAKTLYTKYLTFNNLCGNWPGYLSLYHFLQHNPSVFF